MMRRPVAPSSMQPYERYEQGFVDYFFDPSSTTDKGRFRVYDARDFLVSTITILRKLRFLFTDQVQYSYASTSCPGLCCAAAGEHASQERSGVPCGWSNTPHGQDRRSTAHRKGDEPFSTANAFVLNQEA